MKRVGYGIGILAAALAAAIVAPQAMTPGAQATEGGLSGAYLGQAPPGATPVVFAPGIVSADANEHMAPSFSPDGSEVFWWANKVPSPDNKESPSRSMTMRRENGRWSAPRVTPFGPMAAFSPDGRRLYFGTGKDIWYVEKQGRTWGEPKCLNVVARFPELQVAHMPRIAGNGALYFMAHLPGVRSNLGIYRAELVGGEYARPEALPRSINLPPFTNWAPFIAPDESYLLFSSNRTGSLDTAGDLYISRRLASGGWTDPVNLGEPVNTRRQEVFPGLSPDGRYLFFCRDVPGRENDVYWVSAAAVPALRDVPAAQSTHRRMDTRVERVAMAMPISTSGQADRETWQPPEQILDAIGVRPGMRIGEAGAGLGYFTFPLARRVGDLGVVFANDISTPSLETIRQRAAREGLKTVRTVLGAVEDPLFPEKDLDMIVMVYVLHMLERPVPFLKNLRPYLKPGGSLVIIERNTTVERGHFPSFMTTKQILATVSETGFELDRTETFLPRDTIYLYKIRRLP